MIGHLASTNTALYKPPSRKIKLVAATSCRLSTRATYLVVLVVMNSRTNLLKKNSAKSINARADQLLRRVNRRAVLRGMELAAALVIMIPERM